MRSLAVIATLFLITLQSGCGLLPEVQDETVGWSANKLFTEAKEALNEGSYDKSIKYFEKLESRYPYGRFAQQAQIDIAYAYWKSGETASAVAACDNGAPMVNPPVRGAGTSRVTGKPALRHASMPPSSTATSRCPSQRASHHRRAAYRPPDAS